MNTQLIDQLAKIKGEATIYLKERSFQTDELDLLTYQVLSEYLNEHGGKKKGDLYYELLHCWYYCLMRLKEEEQAMPIQEEEHQPQVIYFYHLFQQHTKNRSMEDKITLLYRYPWHLRTLLIASTGNYFVEDFVHEVASVHVLEEMNFEDVSYLAITPYDRSALYTIQDDLLLGHEEKLTYQLTKNLPVIPFTLQHFETFLKNGADKVEKEDEHGLNILGFLLDLYRKEEPKMSAFQFVLFALSAMCFWHFESNTMNSTWFVKEGKFRHLKSIREKLRNIL